MLGIAANARAEGIEFVAEKSAANNFPSADKRKVPREHIEEVRKAVASSDPEGYARTCEMIADLSHIDPDYASISCPVTLIAGDMDTISPLQRSEDLSKLLGGESWVEVVKSGHQPLIDDFSSTTAAITKFLRNL
jgi:3-oxoadipate enol-lactonase